MFVRSANNPGLAERNVPHDRAEFSRHFIIAEQFAQPAALVVILAEGPPDNAIDGAEVKVHAFQSLLWWIEAPPPPSVASSSAKRLGSGGWSRRRFRPGLLRSLVSRWRDS